MRWLAEGAFAIAVAVAVAACVGEDESEPDGERDAPAEQTTFTSFDERPCPEETFLTFESFGGPFLISWCSGCHAGGLPEEERQGAPLGVDFDDIEQVRAQAERIWARSGDHNVTMPPVGGPEEEERVLLGEWLACGAPTLTDVD